MTKNEINFEAVKSEVSTFFGKVRNTCSEKVKTFSKDPEFIGCDNPKMSLASDGTKACALFNGREPAKEFASKLREQLNVKIDVDSFIGYGTVYVPAENYEEAIQKGVNILLEIGNGCWVDFYNQRKGYKFEPVLILELPEGYFDESGKMKKVAQNIVKVWIKYFETILGEKLLYDEHFGKTLEFGIERKHDAHLKHDEVLDKIRCSGILKMSPFTGYAYVDYCGKCIR